MMKSLFTLVLTLLLGSGLYAQLADRDYADLLTKSLTFYDAQACGPNVDTYSSFDWRGDCHEEDGDDVGLDLTGGWHDAGDHVKFNYPMGFAVIKLASLYADNQAQIDGTQNKDLLLKHLRFVGDYMIKCHPTANSYVIQVGEGVVDHARWQVPEANDYRRVTYIANDSKPATDLACVNAAAFAALSLAFKKAGDADYSATLLRHAKELYNFGDTKRGWFSDHIPSAEANFYSSNKNKGFAQWLALGAIWVHRASGEARYLTAAENAANSITYLGGWAPSFGDQDFEAVYQLAKVTEKSKYIELMERYAVALADGSEGSRSPGGLYYPAGQGQLGFSIPLALGTAYFAYRYAELVGSNNANYQKTKDYAFEQMNYALGDNPLGRSYVVGFGNNSPRVTHHRAAHDPNGTAIDDNPRFDTHSLTGGLVMGPIGQDDSYRNVRNDIKYTEPALGNNAVLALMATLMVKERGITTSPPTPPTPPTGEDEITSTTAPTSVRQGETVTVEVSYSASANRDILVWFQRDNSPFTTYARQKIDVSQGSGTVSAQLTIPGNVPVVSDDYQIQVLIVPNGATAYADRIDNLNKNNIDVRAPAAPSTTNSNIYTDNFNNQWANWSWGGTATVRDGGIKQAGSYSFKYNFNNGGAVSFRHPNGLTGDNLVRLEFWARTWQGNTTFQVSGSYDDDYANRGSATSITVTPTWKKFTVTKEQLGNYGWYRRFFLFNGSTGNTIFMDNVRLVYSGNAKENTTSVRGDGANTLSATLYPNPSSNGSATLDLQLRTAARKLTVEVRDVAGRLLTAQQQTGQLGLNRFQLELGGGASAGVYFVRAFDEAGTIHVIRRLTLN